MCVTHLAVAGPTGMVGRSLLRLLEERAAWLREERRLEFRVVGAINRRTMVWDERGMAAGDTIDGLRTGAPASWELFAGQIQEHREAPVVFLDCTASESISRQYASILGSGASVVTPNKIANTLEYAYYEELQRLGRTGGTSYRYRTTVGAATPMIQALQDLRRTGDSLRLLEGVLSGTLSRVLAGVNAGEHFSSAVRDARERGFTEPHPSADLSGEDVARKLLILVREAGFRLERSAIELESLVSADAGRDTDPEEYLRRLAPYDPAWSCRAALARSRGNVLAYIATFDGRAARAAVTEVPAGSPFARLRPSENAVHYYTECHSTLPLVIQGRGAGPDVTARGVLADLIDTALSPVAREREYSR